MKPIGYGRSRQCGAFAAGAGRLLVDGATMKEGPDLRVTMYLAQRTVLVDYVSHILGSRDAAEDVVQEAFIRFVPAADIKQPTSRPSSYLFRIAHNLALDALRRRKLENTQKGRNAPAWTRPEPTPTPEETVLFCEGIRRAMDLVAELPRQQRVALEMHRFGGYTLEQIAEHLGVSVATTHRLIQAAVATITLRLDHDPS